MQFTETVVIKINMFDSCIYLYIDLIIIYTMSVFTHTLSLTPFLLQPPATHLAGMEGRVHHQTGAAVPVDGLEAVVELVIQETP